MILQKRYTRLLPSVAVAIGCRRADPLTLHPCL